MTIDAILFDIDGTLVDSNDFHIHAWGRALRDAGFEFDASTIHSQIGKGSDTFVESLLPHLDEKRQTEIGEAHGKLFKAEFLKKVCPFPKARDLLARTVESSRKVVLASSASQAELGHYIELLNAGPLIAATISKDDVETSKPAPDIFGTALKRLGNPDPATVLAIGDTPYDIAAAKKCGIDTLAVLSGRFPKPELERAGAIALYDDVAAILASFDLSPINR